MIPEPGFRNPVGTFRRAFKYRSDSGQKKITGKIREFLWKIKKESRPEINPSGIPLIQKKRGVEVSVWVDGTRRAERTLVVDGHIRHLRDFVRAQLP